MQVGFPKHGPTRQSLSINGTEAIVSSPQRLSPPRVREISLAPCEIYSPVAYILTNIQPLTLEALRNAD